MGMALMVVTVAIVVITAISAMKSGIALTGKRFTPYASPRWNAGRSSRSDWRFSVSI
jgi:NADH:ubiquinone oxidoreductase subunit 3 (subunit A)